MAGSTINGAQVNADGLTLHDMARWYEKRFITEGLAKNRREARNLLIETLARNIVVNEIDSIALAIANPEKWAKIIY